MFYLKFPLGCRILTMPRKHEKGINGSEGRAEVGFELNWNKFRLKILKSLSREINKAGIGIKNDRNGTMGKLYILNFDWVMGVLVYIWTWQMFMERDIRNSLSYYISAKVTLEVVYHNV